jgi:hypothetical protein
MTSPARTIIDLADVLPERELARLVDEAEVRGLARGAEVLAAVERGGNGRRGSARLAEILRRSDGPALTRSEAEDRLLTLVACAGRPYCAGAWLSSAPAAPRRGRYSCQAPPRSTGTSSPALVTPVTDTSSPPIMKSTWIDEWFSRPWSSSPAVKR